MKEKLLPIVKFVFFIGLGIFLIWLIVKDLTPQDKQEVINSFKSANYTWVLAGLCTGFLSNLFRSMRWQMMLEATEKKPKLDLTFYAVMVGYLANLAIPRLGEVSKCGIIQQHENIPLEKSFGTVVTERIIDTLTLGFLIVLLMSTQYDLIFNFVTSKLSQTKSDKVSGEWYTNKYFILILFIITGIVVIGILSKTEKGQTLILKIKSLLKGFVNGILSVFRLENKWLFILYTVAIWAMYLATIYLNFRALDDTSHLGLNAGLSILVLGSFAYILVQGGIGAYQLIVMETLVLYGIKSNTGFTLGWIMWSTQTIALILMGVISIMILSFRKKKLTEKF